MSALADGNYLYFNGSPSQKYYYPISHRGTSISYHVPTVSFSDSTSIKYSTTSEMKTDGLTYKATKSDSRLVYLGTPVKVGSRTYTGGYLYTITVAANGIKYNGSAALPYVYLTKY